MSLACPTSSDVSTHAQCSEEPLAPRYGATHFLVCEKEIIRETERERERERERESGRGRRVQRGGNEVRDAHQEKMRETLFACVVNLLTLVQHYARTIRFTTHTKRERANACM